MKLIRYILFIPVCSLALRIVYWGFSHLLTWFIGLSTFWLIIILIFFAGTIWRLFKMLSAMLMGFASMIAPNRMFSFWAVLVLSIINGIWIIYNSWTIDTNYSGKVIFATIVFTILVIDLTIALICGSAEAADTW
jgi:high-affinity Fe2+/Pb2+ permease